MPKGSSRHIFLLIVLDAHLVDLARPSPWFTPSFTNRAERLTKVNTLMVEETRKLQSEEQKARGYRHPPSSLPAEAQSVVDKRDREPITKGTSRGSGKRSSPRPTTTAGS